LSFQYPDSPNFGNSLVTVLEAQEINPGDPAGYQVCKSIFIYHPLGKKMAESPVAQAMAIPRIITVPKGPEDEAVKQFIDTWNRFDVNRHIMACATLARVYGVASVGCLLEKETDFTKPINFETLAKQSPVFNVFDPLNTSGSFVASQDPNSPDFQRNKKIVVAGKNYNLNRTCTLMHEQPIYLDYESSGFGWTGRSVYQRALYPLKSFIVSMRVNDMVMRKTGVLVAKIKSPGSTTDNKVLNYLKIKLGIIKQSDVGNVVGVGHEDDVTSLNLQNIDGTFSTSRKNILEDTAVSADMPAMMLNSETFAEGFADGSEDAKVIVRYLNSVREWFQPLYEYFDKYIQYLAWTPEWYATIQAKYPDRYGSIPFETAFYTFRDSFTAQWPSLLIEPESEQAKNEQVRIGTILNLCQIFLPIADQINKARILDWAQDNLNENKIMFPNPLDLDTEAMAEFQPPQNPGMTGISENSGEEKPTLSPLKLKFGGL
jgi:hypothetical protein